MHPAAAGTYIGLRAAQCPCSGPVGATVAEPAIQKSGQVFVSYTVSVKARSFLDQKQRLAHRAEKPDSEPMAVIAISCCTRTQQQIFCTSTNFHDAARRRFGSFAHHAASIEVGVCRSRPKRTFDTAVFMSVFAERQMNTGQRNCAT